MSFNNFSTDLNGTRRMGILRLSRMQAKQIVQMRKDEERVEKNLKISLRSAPKSLDMQNCEGSSPFKEANKTL